MRFCKNCGSQITGNQAFCNNCGEKIAQPVAPESRQAPPTGTTISSDSTRKKEKTSLTKKTKISIFAGIAVLIILIVIHFVIQSQFTPMKAIEEFDQAIQTKDAKALAKIMNNGQNKVEMTEKEASAYINYLKKENDYKEIKKELTKQASLVEERMTKPINDDSDNKLFNLVRAEKKKWLLYDQYQLNFYPIELVISSNLEGTSLVLNGKKLSKKTNDESYVKAGYFLPGEYELKGEYKGEYSDFEYEEILDFTKASENMLEVDIEFEYAEPYVYSNDDNAILYVNGKNTKITIADIDTVGPFATDGSITLQAQRKVDGKTQKTEPYEITYDESEVYLYFEYQDESDLESESLSEADSEEITEADMSRFMDSFYTASTRSINARDISLVEDVYDLSGKAYPEAKNYLVTLEKKGITENYLGMELVSFVEAEGGYNVTTQEEYNIYYSDGSSKNKTFQTQYFVTLLDEGLRVHTLMSTNEISSDDL